jgi:NDP-sugar pyrophosphorylase family protein
VNIVMPMAGHGRRFVEAGYSAPKPLIDVLGRPMYSWAVDGLPLAHAKRLIFVCLRMHLESLDLERDIQTRYARYNPIIVSLDKVTQGQACTVLETEKWIDNPDPLLIFNADTHCRTTLDKSLAAWPPDVAGALDVFRAEGDKWSFVSLDGPDRVIETAEKRRISAWASTGLYYFRHGRDFVRHSKAMIADNDRVNNEFYIAPLYNRMIAEGLDIRANVVSDVWAMGTPEDLSSFKSTFPLANASNSS